MAKVTRFSSFVRGFEERGLETDRDWNLSKGKFSLTNEISEQLKLIIAMEEVRFCIY